MSKLRRYPHLRLALVLGTGALLAAALCIQCVRTYWYTDAVLVPQEAEREADRQSGALSAAARGAAVSDPHALAPVIGHALEAAGERVIWMRILDQENRILAQGGTPLGTPKIPARWWEHVEKHESLGTMVDTPQGKAFVTMLPFRMPRPPRPPDAANANSQPPDAARNGRPPFGSGPGGGPGGRRAGALVLELAIPLKAVEGEFEGLRHNLILGLIASMALLVAIAVIAVRTPHYLRGRYLESELQLARRVQHDLQPKPQPVSPHVDFAASAVAADHVGGDFHDIFETASGKIAIVLGDVSGKGVSAALLVSVLQGAIRSSTATQHESACERINRMLCERTACERFATLFWGVYDPTSGILRYVNAGHAAPMLIRRGQERIQRLDEGGGPVLGMLPAAHYTAATIEVQPSDTLIVYSDGIHEATNQQQEEFGEERIQQVISGAGDAHPTEVCEQIMQRVSSFACAESPQDDRTLMVVRFPRSLAALTA